MASVGCAAGVGLVAAVFGVGALAARRKRTKKLLVKEAGGLAECPRWHNGRLYYSDFYGHKVKAVSLDGSVEEIAQVDDALFTSLCSKGQYDNHGPAGLGFLPDGSLLITEIRGRRILKLAPGEKEPKVFVDLKPHAEWYANDMVVDEQGNAYVGNYGFNIKEDFEEQPDPVVALVAGLPKTHMIRVTPDGKASPCTPKDVLFPNGAVITPEGDKLIVAQTFAVTNNYGAFPRNKDGTLGEYYVWANIPGLVPDGMCLDAEGCLWVAAPALLPNAPVYSALYKRFYCKLSGADFCSAFVRIKEGGEILEVIPTSWGRSAAACVLGGPDGHTLFMLEATTASVSAIEPMVKDGTAHKNSQIWTARVDVPAAKSQTCAHYCAGYC